MEQLVEREKQLMMMFQSGKPMPKVCDKRREALNARCST